MRAKKRKAQIRQRQKKRRKNVSFKELSGAEVAEVASQQKGAEKKSWYSRYSPKSDYLSQTDRRTLKAVEEYHGVKLKPIVEELSSRFQDETLEGLDEGAGKSSFARDMRRLFGKRLKVIKTDVRGSWLRKVIKANVLDLVKTFGKNRFHFVVSTGGGGEYSPLPEKAFYQIVSVLKPGGIGIVGTSLALSKTPLELEHLAKRFNITLRGYTKLKCGFVFTKNFGRKKKR